MIVRTTVGNVAALIRAASFESQLGDNPDKTEPSGNNAFHAGPLFDQTRDIQIDRLYPVCILRRDANEFNVQSGGVGGGETKQGRALNASLAMRVTGIQAIC